MPSTTKQNHQYIFHTYRAHLREAGTDPGIFERGVQTHPKPKPVGPFHDQSIEPQVWQGDPDPRPSPWIRQCCEVLLET